MSLGALAVASGLLASVTPMLIDELRELDLNDYAAGITFSARTLPYRGADGTWSVYPFLTSVEDATLTTTPVVFRDGAFGLREVLASGFEFGLLAHVETLGFGTDAGPELASIEPPAWTLELGPTIGWRGLPVQPDLSVFKGVLGGHSGLTARLSLSVPVELARGYVVPYLAAIHQDQDFVAYYYDVPPDFGGEPYVPAAATNLRAGVRLGYRITDLWILTASAWVEALDDAITDSPIVGDQRLLGAQVGLAYNRSIFEQSNPDASTLTQDTRFELRGAAVFASVDSDLRRELTAAPGPASLELEELLGVDDSATILRADGTFRLGERHRIEVGYAELQRSATVVLGRDVQLGDAVFRAGEEVTARYRVRYPRAAYGYSFFRDEQKELGVLLGVQAPRLGALVAGEAGETVEREVAETPTPSVGAFARVALEGAFSASAQIETAYVDFDGYGGQLIDFYGVLDWEPRPWLGLSLGYAIKHLRLEAFDTDFIGSARQRYSGFFAGFRVTF